MSDECECPLRPGEGSGNTFEQYDRARAQWDREHTGHPWANQRDELARRVLPQIEEVMAGRGPREWRMLQQIVGALALALVAWAGPAHAAPFMDLFGRAWSRGEQALAILKQDHKDLVREEWTAREQRCAVLKVTLGLVELALNGTNAFTPSFTETELLRVRQFLVNQRATECKPPSGKSSNAGLEFIRAVEVRSKNKTPTGLARAEEPLPADLSRALLAAGAGLGTGAEAAPAVVMPPLLSPPPPPAGVLRRTDPRDVL